MANNLYFRRACRVDNGIDNGLFIVSCFRSDLDLDEFVVLEGFIDGIEHGLGQSLTAEQNDGLKGVGARPEKSNLSVSQCH